MAPVKEELHINEKVAPVKEELNINEKVAPVKEESFSNPAESDAGLLSWSTPKCEIIKEEDRKPDMSQFESDVDNSSSDGESDESISNNSSSKNCEMAVENKSVNVNEARRRKIIGETQLKAGIKKLPSSKPYSYHTWVEVLENSPVCNSVSNKCEFQCLKCPLVFTSRGYLYRHLRKTHAELSMKDFKRHLVKIVAHECQICSKRILCEKVSISYHIKAEHNVRSLQAYCDEHKIEYENKCQRETVSAKPQKRKFFGQQSWFERLEQAPISDKVDNLCVFECPKCSTKFKSRKNLLVHFRRTKHSVENDRNVNDYLIKVKGYHCTICSKKILCDKTSIITHIKSRHDKTYSLKKYYSDANVKHEQTSVEERELDHFCESQKFEISDSVLNLCTFSCTKCAFQSSTWPNLNHHIHKLAHGPLLKPLQHIKHAKLYKCLICLKLLFCDSKIIQTHIRCKHKINLSKYIEINNLPNFKDYYQKQVRLAIRDIPAFEQKLLNHFDLNTLMDNEVTKHIGNMTLFKCHECDYTETTYQYLIRHLKKVHQVSFISKHIHSIVEARIHKCHICAKNIICDNTLIRRHVINHHHINLTKYLANHVQKCGYEALPTFGDFKANNRIFETIKLNLL